jgi:hypothetical protein
MPCQIAFYVSLLVILSTGCVGAQQFDAGRSAQTDHELESLLLKVEQQITARHVSSPADDNAMDTWLRVIERVYMGPPDGFRAVAFFAQREQKRAADEAAAGRSDLSDDLNLFADLAKILTTSGIGPTQLSSQAEPLREVVSSSVWASPVGNSRPPATPSTVPGLTGVSVTDTPSTTGETADMVLVVRPVNSEIVAPTAREDPLAGVYADRGDGMLAIKDISAARKLYEYAANAGSARAAMALAKTYDPDSLRQLGAIGVKPDLGLATAWYHKAAALGNHDAMTLLDRFAESGSTGPREKPMQ